MDMENEGSQRTGLEIAVIGMAGRFPGAGNIARFWENLVNGMESISFFSDEELKKAGMNSLVIENPAYVRSCGVLENSEYFDSAFFGYTPNEAELMNPQTRIFHECVWTALEDAGYDPGTCKGGIGLYAGAASGFNWELMTLLRGGNHAVAQFAAGNLTNKDSFATRVSHKLDLKGPSLSIHTACSTSLVAIHQACRALLTGECSMAAAGGISVYPYQRHGYIYQEGMIMSPDGHCRAFDSRAGGIVGGCGAGVVVLKPLDSAVADRDHIYAIVKGSTVNNDGVRKVGFSAPSVEGQAEAVRAALEIAQVPPETIGYVETHGTGTDLGDPVEIEALKLAFNTQKKKFCAIGSVKSNFGHLNSAAGVAGFIKAALALTYRLIPPSLHFEAPNSKIDFDNSPFYVNAELSRWAPGAYPRRAGISSFGIGGTNAHVILEEAPNVSPTGQSREYQLILLSAKTESALDRMTKNLVEFFKKGVAPPTYYCIGSGKSHKEEKICQKNKVSEGINNNSLLNHGNHKNPVNPGLTLADAAYTLQAGRRHFLYRRMAVGAEITEVVEALENPGKPAAPKETPYVIFMFPGQGAQYIHMGEDLYRSELAFRQEMDRCFEILTGLVDYNLKEILYPGISTGKQSPPVSNNYCSSNRSYRFNRTNIPQINQTRITQPVLFAFEYSLARLLMAWGIKPGAMVGHSIGEYVAACLSGVLSLEDALRLVVLRGKLMQRMPPGAMTAVNAPEQELKALLPPDISLAAINSPVNCVISGNEGHLIEFEKTLTKKGWETRRLHTSHAFHSWMMDPVLTEFAKGVKKVRLNKPGIPYISNVTGKWISAGETQSPSYWVTHLRNTVRFADGLAELFKHENPVFLEPGPGKTLCTFVRQHQPKNKKITLEAFNLVRHPKEHTADHRYLLEKIGGLWLRGVSLDWETLHRGEKRYRTPLPTYSFEPMVYPAEGNPLQMGQALIAQGNPGVLTKKEDMADWFYIPSWQRSGLGVPAGETAAGSSLVFMTETPWAQQLIREMQERGMEVITAKPGKGFHRQDHRLYCLDPANADDYYTLFAELNRSNRTPNIIVHLWNVTGTGEESLEDRCESSMNPAFYSLLHIAGAIGKQGIRETLHIKVVTDNLQDIGGEGVLSPEKALVIGPVNAIPQEYPNIRCQAIDIQCADLDSHPPQSLADMLVTEFKSQSPDTLVAYRGPYRWTLRYEPVHLESPGQDQKATPTRLRHQGVYLVTGGFGGIGFTLAQYLASHLEARLLLVGRSVFPKRQDREKWLTTHLESDAISQRIRKMMELEKQGAAFMTFSADVTRYPAMEAVVQQGKQRFGNIHGIIHCAGIGDYAGVIGKRSREMSEEVLAPKIRGTLVLEKLFKTQELDFFLLCSSIASITAPFGQVSYSAANAFLDAFANYRQSRDQSGHRNSNFTTSINWCTWKEAGMAVEAVKMSAVRDPEGALQYGLLPDQGVEAFLRILQNHFSQVAVSPLDLKQRLRLSAHLTRQEEPGQEQLIPVPAGGSIRQQRPELTSEFAAPRDQLEEIVAEIWRDYLGLERVGIHDDFFELGGDSLLGMKFVNRYQQLLGEIVHVTVMFDAPTIALTAAYFKNHYQEAAARLIPLEKPGDIGITGKRVSAADIAAARNLIPRIQPIDMGDMPKNKPALFILSPPRSGSTLLRVMLGGHPRVFAPPELVLLSSHTLQQAVGPQNNNEGVIRAIMQIKQYSAAEAREILRGMKESRMTVHQFYARLQEWLGDKILVDKSPTYAMDPRVLERMEREFENPFYIHLLRHPYGMIRSYEEARMDLLKSSRLLNDLSLSRRQLAELIWTISQENILAFLKDIPQNRQLQVKFEDLVNHPLPVTTEICQFLGLDFHEEMLDPYREKQQRMTDGIHPDGLMIGDVKFHQHNGIEASVADKWKNHFSRDFLGDATWKVAETLGYRSPGRETYSPIAPAPTQAHYPLSSAQERLFVLQQLEPDSIGYNMPGIALLEGKLEKERFETAVHNLIQRHDSLRTSFEIVDDKPVQKIHPRAELEIQYTETDEAGAKTVIEDFRKPFDLAGAPLVRLGLIRLSKDKHIFIREIHHIVSDGSSMILFDRDLMALYRGQELPPLKIQYKDYALWQQSEKETGNYHRQQGFWLREFPREIPVLNLPTDFSRPPFQVFTGKGMNFTIDSQQAGALKTMARQEGTTVYMLLLAIFTLFLSKLGGQEDIVVGTDTAGRKHADLENIIGMFVNTLALRNYPGGEKTFRSFLAEVREKTLAAFENQDYPFETLVDKVVKHRDTSRNPLFDVMFSLQTLRIDPGENIPPDSPDLKMVPFRYEKTTSKFDLSLFVSVADELHFSFEYCRRLFKDSTIQRFSHYFKQLVTSILDNIDGHIAGTTMIPDQEKQRILMEFNRSKRDFPREHCFHRLFQDQVLETPDAAAVSYKDLRLTYRELNKAANGIAHYLRQCGIKPGTIAALHMKRGIEMLAAIIGVFKAGGAYLPLEQDYPEERISFILENSEASVFLTHPGYPRGIEPGALLCLEPGVSVNANESLKQLPVDNPPATSTPGDLAYVIYTSGTTGKPKGVMIHHLGMLNHLLAKINDLSITAGDRIAQTASACFDISVWQFLALLLQGGVTEIIDKEEVLEAGTFLRLLQQRRITILESVPSMMTAFLETAAGAPDKTLKYLRWMIPTGEALNISQVKEWYRHYPEIKLVNAYGPTEASDDVTHYVVEEMPDDSWLSVPVGKPLQNLHIYILDNNLSLCPIGVRGEICVAGIGVGKGYWQDEEKTRQAFVPNPYLEEIGDSDYAVLYKTGDIGFFRQDGCVECLGRLDHQVKIRGNRIELGEIENRLMQHESVKEAVVTARTLEKGETLLCAYTVLEEPLPSQKLRDHLAKVLPPYMIPSYFLHLESLPLTPNGKIDRKALPAPEINTKTNYMTPGNRTEETLIHIWADLLGKDTASPYNVMGIDDNFFEIGGHSLKATLLVSRVHKELDVKIPLADVFKNPTIRQLSASIQEARTDIYTSIDAAPRQDYYALSPAQTRVYVMQQLENQSTGYNEPSYLLLDGTLDISRLTTTFKTIIQRHESLRTAFIQVEGEPFQEIRPEVDFQIEYYELAEENPDKEKEILRDFIRPFDLSQPPLLRVGIVKKGKTCFILMIDIHHIITDDTTMGIVVREAITLYSGQHLPPVKLQFKDFSHWQNRLIASGEIRQQESYWLEQFKAPLPQLNLPLDYPRPRVRGFEGEDLRFEIPVEETEKLKHLAMKEGATLFMVFLALYYVFLAKITNQEDIIVGTPILGRRHADLENVVGMFVNTLVLRNFLSPAKTFREFLKEVKENCLDAYENQDYQFEDLVNKVAPNRDTSRNPIFDVMFVFINPETAVDEVPVREIPDLRLEPYRFAVGVSKLDMTLSGLDEGSQVHLTFQYWTRLFKRETIERFIRYFKDIVTAAAANQDIPLGDIQLSSNFVDIRPEAVLEEGDFAF